MRTHCEFIYEYLVQHELSRRVILVYRREKDTELANYLKEYREKMSYQGSPYINIVDMSDTIKRSLLKLKDSLYFTDKNIIIIASSNEAFVSNAMKQISRLQQEFTIEVIGMPTWNNFSQSITSQFDTVKTKITSSYFLDTTTPQAESFRAAYHNMFDFNPTANSVRGYDVMLYFGNQLLQFDNKFMGFFPDASLLGGKYKIASVMKTPDILYRENKSVFMLQYSLGKWQFANQ